MFENLVAHYSICTIQKLQIQNDTSLQRWYRFAKVLSYYWYRLPTVDSISTSLDNLLVPLQCCCAPWSAWSAAICAMVQRWKRKLEFAEYFSPTCLRRCVELQENVRLDIFRKPNAFRSGPARARLLVWSTSTSPANSRSVLNHVHSIEPIRGGQAFSPWERLFDVDSSGEIIVGHRKDPEYQWKYRQISP